MELCSEHYAFPPYAHEARQKREKYAFSSPPERVGDATGNWADPGLDDMHISQKRYTCCVRMLQIRESWMFCFPSDVGADMNPKASCRTRMGAPTTA